MKILVVILSLIIILMGVYIVVTDTSFGDSTYTLEELLEDQEIREAGLAEGMTNDEIDQLITYVAEGRINSNITDEEMSAKDRILEMIIEWAQAQEEAKIAVAKTNFSQLRAQMELHYTRENTYAGGCKSSVVVDLLEEAEAGLEDSPSCLDTPDQVDSTDTTEQVEQYVSFGTLLDGSLFCVDSTGYAGEISVRPRSDTNIACRPSSF